ncbi:helix-turn-helix domain-containing protein [Tumebacillus avium]
MSIRQVALYAGVSGSYLSLLERQIVGTNGPTPKFLKKLSKPLDVPYELPMKAAGHYDDFISGVETVPVSFLPLLRFALLDDQEQFAERIGLSVAELRDLEASTELTAETVSMIFNSLFAKHLAFKASEKEMFFSGATNI